MADVHLVPALRTNAIIVTAPTKTMNLIEKLIEELDTTAAAAANVKVFTLKKAERGPDREPDSATLPRHDDRRAAAVAVASPAAGPRAARKHHPDAAAPDLGR